MYLEHFEFSEKPFSLTPDTGFFYGNPCHLEAFNTIRLALSEGEGFLKIVGEVGTGKTLLCRKLLSYLHQPGFVTAFIPNPWLSPEELKVFLASELAVDLSALSHSHEITAAIYRKLVQLARQNKKVVMLIDEAQAMPIETIESLRLLTNLESEKRKLLQVVVFGQPELDELLARKELRQLQQRIVFSDKLMPLSKPAVGSYIRHRIKATGGREDLFSTSAIWLIEKASRGIPRLINIIAHKALISAYGRGDRTIVAWHIARAIADTPESGRFAKKLAIFWRYPKKLNTTRVVSAS